MPYAIIRFEKVKSFAAVSAMSAHWHRTRPTPNADPAKRGSNRVQVGSGNVEADVRAGLAGQSPRKNAVLAMEAILTTSPEFFENASAEDKKKWLATSVDWLKREYGKNLVSAVLHLDETTPHLHAVILPIDQRGRLNAREMFNREHLRHVQQSYPGALKDLGLQRGIERSRATHVDVKKFYGALRQPVPAIQYRPLPPVPPVHQRTEGKLMEWAGQIKKETIAAISPAYSNLGQKSKTADLDRQRERRQAAAHNLAARDRDYQMQLAAEARQQAAALRCVELTEVAAALGYEYERSRQVWKAGDSTISINGQKYFDHEAGRGGGGAIDLVIHATGHAYREALRWLADRFGTGRSASTALDAERTRIEREIEDTPRAPFIAPPSRFSSEDDVHHYLTSKRGLSADLVRSAIKTGDVYGDDRKNAVFLRRAPSGGVTGCMKRGTQPARFVQVLGDKKTGWYSYGERKSPRVIAICESAIDALSFYDLQQQAGAAGGLLVISTDGCGQIPDDLAERYPGAKIVAAPDNDKAGDSLAAKIREHYPQAERLKPQGKDWNEDLLQARTEEAAPTPAATYRPGPR